MPDREGDPRILRDVLIRELETIQEYLAMLERASDDDVRRFLAHAIQEEKEHVAEAFQLLRSLDPMQDRAAREDHSAHFSAGGPGDLALAELGGADPAGVDAVGGEVAAEESLPGGSEETTSKPEPENGRLAAEPSPPMPNHRIPGIGITAPSARLDQPTVGNLRPAP